ncbi:MAG TPA: AMP-binding protein [Zeimonas sp.]|nr:AMP-binding protein [Zeimonas sp.]
MTLNAASVLLANGNDDDVALVCGTQTRSYGELREAVARAAGAWHARGLRPGERVAVQIPDGFAWVESFLGCIAAGGVAVGVNPRLPSAEWQSMLETADFRFVLAESRAETPAPYRERVIALEEWLVEHADAEPRDAMPCEPTQPAVWVHSSGTSGKPKAVVHGHRFALEIERVTAEVVGATARDRIFASSKMFFSYPQTNALYAGLKLGASVVLDPAWPTAAGVAETVARTHPTVLCSVPSLYRNLLKEGLAARLVRDGVRRFVSAGEALSTDLRDEWHRQTGAAIINGYGASETLVLVMTDRDDGRGLRPSPGIDARPLAGTGASPTRLSFAAPMIALGYWNLPAEQNEHFRDGRFCPSDLFEPQADGSWRFAGREGSLVKVHGRWVDLIAIEETLGLVSDDILEAAAVLVPDDDGVDAVAVFYVPKDPASPQRAEAALRTHAETMPPYRRPRWFHPIDALPRTPTGKLIRRRLQDLHKSQ